MKKEVKCRCRYRFFHNEKDNR